MMQYVHKNLDMLANEVRRKDGDEWEEIEIGVKKEKKEEKDISQRRKRARRR